ncbi:hypothetical protein CW304_29940 [Bacillus sp. UFRGS-B20]|nr:hypothetical protein CW304_29940 [Bacillus sp. UFRGS-B20]
MFFDSISISQYLLLSPLVLPSHHPATLTSTCKNHHLPPLTCLLPHQYFSTHWHFLTSSSF